MPESSNMSELLGLNLLRLLAQNKISDFHIEVLHLFAMGQDSDLQTSVGLVTWRRPTLDKAELYKAVPLQLELLDPRQLHDNKFLSHPVAVEQYLMEGGYNRVFKTRSDIPADSYAFFHDIMADTVRYL